MDPFQRKPSPPRWETIKTPSSGTLRAAQRLAASGQYPQHYTRMREILIGYLSPILVDSVLDKALGTRGLTPTLVTPHTLAELTSDIMIGLRLFVPEKELPRLMLELADLLGSS